MAPSTLLPVPCTHATRVCFYFFCCCRHCCCCCLWPTCARATASLRACARPYHSASRPPFHQGTPPCDSADALDPFPMRLPAGPTRWRARVRHRALMRQVARREGEKGTRGEGPILASPPAACACGALFCWTGPGWPAGRTASGAGPGWAGPGWVRPGWVEPGWVGPGWVGPGWVGCCCCGCDAVAAGRTTSWPQTCTRLSL